MEEAKKERRRISILEMMKNMEKKSTHFTLACALLSKMVKEKGSLADLDLPQGTHRPPTTINLLHGLDASADKQAETHDTENVTDRDATKCMELFPVGDTGEQEKSQLTIFYDGNVLVFDDFPAEKVKDLMQMAGSIVPTRAADRLPENCPSVPGSLPAIKLNHGTDLMAQTRRASLHRFINKRKERINSNAPYQINGSSKKLDAIVKPEETRSWLGLGQEISRPPTTD